MSENYHKAALGGGVVVLAAVGYLSWSKGAEIQKGFDADPIGTGNPDASARGGDLVDATAKSLKVLDKLNAKKTSEGRIVDLFTSVDMFVANGEVEEPIDLLDPNLPPIHLPIPNPWWVENRVDPSYSDSLDRDKDGDGFSNLEEFTDKTDPSDDTKYPPLVNKLVVKSIDSTYWLLELNSTLGNGNLQFRFADSKGANLRMGAAQNVKAGDLFFQEAPVENRFKVIETGSDMVEEKGRQVEKKFALVEDLKPNKGKNQFKAPFRPKGNEKPGFYQFDNTVTFILDAVGQGDKEIVVPENTSFKVTAHGKTLEYKLVKIDMGQRPNLKPLAAIVESDDNGQKSTRRIPISE
jgi:hypothetical protein